MTGAELALDEKNRISHRGRALAALVARIDMTRGEKPLASALRLHALAVKRNNV